MAKKNELKHETIKRLKDLIKSGMNTKEKLFKSEAFLNLFNHYMNKFEKGYVDIIIDACLKDLNFNEIKTLIKKEDEEKEMRNDKNQSEVEQESDKIFMISGQKVVETGTPINVEIGDADSTICSEEVFKKLHDMIPTINASADVTFMYGIINVLIDSFGTLYNLTDTQRSEIFNSMCDIVRTMSTTSISRRDDIERVEGEVIVTTPIEEDTNNAVTNLSQIIVTDQPAQQSISKSSIALDENDESHPIYRLPSYDKYLDCDVSKLSVWEANKAYARAARKKREHERQLARG